MKATKETLADKIADILTTAPGLNQDIEADDSTSAKLVDFVAENDSDEELLSKFRKQNIDLLGDVDERYAGKRSSRKNLKEESDLDDSEDDIEAGESEVGSEKISDKTSEGESDEVAEEESDVDENESDNNLNEYEGDESHSEIDSNEEGDNFKHVKDLDSSTQLKKGFSVRNQMNIWENLLEMRIQMQKCLVAANKMPRKEVYNEMKDNREYVQKSTQVKKSVGILLDKLLQLQTLTLKNYPETKKLMKDEPQQPQDDEEIPSDTEEEEQSDSEGEQLVKKPRLLADYEQEISGHHSRYSAYRNSVIQKWHEKTRLAVLKQSTAPQSVINHIEHTLSNRAKLIKRTQLKRSDYQILGEDKDEDNNEKESKANEEYNTEIFDDDDFYHQLLRELIEVKSADLTDPVQLGQQWMQLQNLRSKMKRKIDTRATKGRKIRYAVHTKLVNFMAPIEENTWKDDAKTELYNSLFGKRQIIGS